MLIDDEEVKKKPKAEFPRLLEGVSDKELGEYREQLVAEIARVDSQLRNKQSIHASAEALFKK